MIEKTLLKINNIIGSMVCCDFEILGYIENSLIIGGGLSLSYPHRIIINFEEVFFMQINHEWSINTKKNFIEIANFEEANKINKMFSIEQGFTLFKIFSEQLEDEVHFYIASKNISVSDV